MGPITGGGGSVSERRPGEESSGSAEKTNRLHGLTPRPHPFGGFRRDWQLYAMLALPLLYFLIFEYVPMTGLIIAFRRFLPGGPLFGVEWVGARYFSYFLPDPTFWRVFRNTLILNFYALVFGFPLPIIFALLLNEFRDGLWKRTVQTLSYLPRFLSTVIVAGIVHQLLSPNGGLVNVILGWFGVEPVFFMARPEWFRPVYVLSGIWQHLGWSAIIYLAALSRVDEELYDTAEVDGAGRFRQAIHVTLPSIAPTIVILFILQLGRILTSDFEKVLLLYNPLTYEVADVLSTFVYRVGLMGNNYSYGTAVGLFNAVISFALVFGANQISRKFSDSSLW